MTVTVLRNQAPSFSPATQSRTIREDVDTDFVITDLVPTDPDRQVSKVLLFN